MTHHTHPCISCGEPLDCNAGRINNYDGWPPVLCEGEADHATFLCEDCADLPQCDNCGLRLPATAMATADSFTYCPACAATEALPCAHCDQPTTFWADLPDGPTPVCRTCQRAGEVDTCAGCGTVHWQKDLTRLYGSANLYCVNCTPVNL